MRSYARCAALLLLCLAPIARAAETETQYLSGLGKDDPVKWEFKTDKGQNSGKWTTISVPSNWELQGFGIYSYGDVKPADGYQRVHGIYKRTFTTPAKWRGKAIFVDFEGVMTDTQVTVNGQSAGPMHQGGYYAFKYDITNLLKPAGQENEIQVDVDDESANASMNRAERRGDYWNYGGIFRPVFLEAVPKTFIDHLALNATAAGSLDVDVRLADTRATPTPTAAAASIEAQVLDLNGKPVGAPITVKDVDLNATAHLSGTIANPRLWTAETPNLYQLEVRLKLGGAVIHTVHQRFGFRTIELRPGQGMFVNGSRVFLKGFSRHSFWPDSGRTLSQQISIDDINLIKEMNGNAVRSSHYPPDRHFLDACDELGLYVLDELNGWQKKYDTDIGQKLVKEMVEHDVNHPSIIFWDNGNEGGWNTDLDGEFAKYDPEKRVVLHPSAPYPLGIADTNHYPSYDNVLKKLAADPVYFPTEMLHGLYDGGAGAGMQDYWDALLKSKAGAGGFVWSLIDEDVKRTDKGGILDSQGNYAPDGVVGPYREREASSYAIKQLWSPIIVAPDPTSHTLTVTNRYAFLNADTCTFEWQAIAFAKPADPASGSIVLASRTDQGRSLAPGASAPWDNWGPPVNRSAKKIPDAARLIIHDHTGRIIQTYVWPINDLNRQFDQAQQSGAGAAPTATESDASLTATAGDLTLQIDKTTGLLTSASRNGQTFSFANGPRVVAMTPRLPQPRRQRPGDVTPPPPPPPPPVLAPASKLTSLTHASDGNDLVITAAFDGPMKSVTYRLKPSGWLSIDYIYNVTGPQEYFGVGFDYPEANVKGIRYLGEGPAPVYQNRVAGGVLDVWNKPYNDTMDGDPDDLKPGQHFDYTLFKGFYAGVRWLELTTSEGPITAVLDQHPDAPVYVQIFTPKFPPLALRSNVAVPYPTAGISFLDAISAIGNKFGPPKTMGPMSQPATAQGDYKGHLSLYFGKLPKQ